MNFQFLNKTNKFFISGIIGLIVCLCPKDALSQSEQSEQPIAPETNAQQTNVLAIASQNAEINAITNLPEAVEINKQQLKISDQTSLAIAAFLDGVLPTAEKLAREQLQACTDFSTLDAEILFHIAMLANQSNSIGAKRSVELLDSPELFTQLWGAELPTAMPPELKNAAQFWKACCLADLNERDAAISILKGLVDENKFNYDFLRIEVLRRLCYELILEGKLEEAVKYFETTTLPPTIDPLLGESIVLFKLGYVQALFQLNNLPAAEEELKKIIAELDASSQYKAIAILFNMELYLSTNNSQKAVELYQNSKQANQLENCSPRINALLLCKYAQALANESVNGDAEEIATAISSAKAAVDSVYSSEERMICLETLIKIMAATKRYDDVTREINKLIEYAPNSSYGARVLRHVAQIYYGNGDYMYAYEAYNLYLHSFTKSIYEYDVMLASAECLVNLGSYYEAALQYKRAANFVDDVEKQKIANYRAGDAYFKSENYPQAAECFKSVLEKAAPPDKIAVQSELYCAKAYENFDLDLAKEKYIELSKSELLELKEPAIMAIASICFKNGELTKALDHYEKLIEMSTSEEQRKSYAFALLGRGMVELKTNRYNDALKSFEESEKAKDGGEASIRAAYLKTQAFYSLGQDQMAYSNTVTFLKQFPESPLVIDAEFWIAKYKFNAHNYAEAEELFLAFCNKWGSTPLAATSHLLAIYSMLEQEKYAEIITHTALWIDTYNNEELLGEVLFINGDARSKLLQFDLAAHSYAQAAKNASSQELKLRALMRQADCLYTLGADNIKRYDEAITIYSELVNFPSLHRGIVLQLVYKLAKCYEKCGLINKAIECYYVQIVLQTEKWAREADNTNVVNYLQAIGGSIWYSRAIIDAAALYEQIGTKDALSAAEELLGRILETQLPIAEEAKMMLNRIRNSNSMLLINEEK